MATIYGSTTVKYNDNCGYILQTDEPVNESSIVWTISTVVANIPYSVNDYGRETVIGFNNSNKYNLDVTIKVAYKLKDGTPKSLQKKIVLLGKTGEREPSTTPKVAAPDAGNKSAVVNVPDDRAKEEEKGVILKIHVYFDGTFGNKDNIDRLDNAADKVLGEKEPDIHDPKYQVPPPDINDKKYQLGNGKVDNKRYQRDIENHDPVNRKKYEEDLAAYKKKVKKKRWEIMNKADSRGILEKLIIPLAAQMDHLKNYDPLDDETSYTQVYTNIPIMYDIEEIEEITDEKLIKIYIEGVGTENGEGDDMLALATGSNLFGTGIPGKIKRAFTEIKKEVKKKVMPNDFITKVEVCVMGFSRGAATTRNFVAEREKMVSTLKKINKSISDDILTYKFVGVFDTVCSVTGIASAINPKTTLEDEDYNDYITRLQRNNIKDYKLAMRGNAEEIVHLTAADEYRIFFPLTNIQTSIDAGCGFELILPGSHCDLGGGDAALIQEKYTKKVMNGDSDVIPKFLIENGWYPNGVGIPILKNGGQDVYIPTTGPWTGGGVIKVGEEIGRKYDFERKVVVGYNRIPLAIMLHYANELGEIKHSETLSTDSTRVHKDLERLKEEFVSYAKSSHGHKRDTYLTELFNKKYNKLRHKYIHLSASPKKFPTSKLELKDRARFGENDELCRAIFNDGDAGVSSWTNGIKNIGKKIGDPIKEGIRQTERRIEQITKPPYF